MIKIHFVPVVQRRAVSIHAWGPSGIVWDREMAEEPNGVFVYDLDPGECNVSQIQFKFRFPLAQDAWEADSLTRFLFPTPNNEIWTFDFSPRCMVEDPAVAAVAPTQLQVIARTSRLKDGQLFVWLPTLDRMPTSESFDKTGTDPATGDPIFTIPIRDWMANGFHFKLRKGDIYERDEAIRVWRPVDGDKVWIKSGQSVVRTNPLQMFNLDAVVVYAKTDLNEQRRAPILHLSDASDEFDIDAEPVRLDNIDDTFTSASNFHSKQTQAPVPLYEGGIYWMKTDREGDQNKRFMHIHAKEKVVIIEGDRRIFTTIPARDIEVKLVVHPNRHSAFDSHNHIHLHVGIGDQQPFTTVEATKNGEIWNAAVRVFTGAACWFDITPSGGISEARPDGPFSTRRIFQGDISKTLHTIDGVSGCSTQIGTFRDVAVPQRKQVLKSAFTEAIVDAGIFNDYELPHGATVVGNEVWFVLNAPHAVRSRLLLFKDSQTGGQRNVTTCEMTLTDDLRYWWCKIPKSEAPHGKCYRFLLNDNEEILDPAARWTNGTDRLWPAPGESMEGPWGRIVDRAQILDVFQGSQWKTIGWEALMIYELHPLRFSKRKENLLAFDRVKAELQPGGYLHDLGVTALEFLPLNEYPKAAGWGYDPSLPFAIEASYGGPEKFASLVRAAHDSGKGVILDVVYNHSGAECPLYAVGGDVYYDGDTCWGRMVNFDHPAAMEFFRQALMTLWDSYQLDGFRFDCTRAIIERSGPVEGSVKTGGSGGGWEFLRFLTDGIRHAANAKSQPWPYNVAENDPINSELTRDGVTDGQWHFGHLYALGEAAIGKEKTDEIIKQMNFPHSNLRPFYEAVRCVCTHDACSLQENWKKRVAARAPYDTGFMMAKAMAASVILAKGVPMIFMGQEVAEDQPFFFGMDKLDDPSRYLRLDYYEANDDHKKVRSWFTNLLGLRNNPHNGIQRDDDQQVARGYKTVAFTRGWGRFFVIATFGTTDVVQNLGWLGLPGGAVYKEIFNSSASQFNVKYEPVRTNGSYAARLSRYSNINLPPTGAVVLEKV